MRMVFMGTPDFAVPALRAIHAAGHEVVAAYSQPPRAAGRGKKPRPSPVHRAAAELGIEVFTPLSLKSPEVQSEFALHRADVAVVAAYGLILPQAILDTPRLGCFNIHASLLPRWRGAAPIHRAVMAGDEKTGVTIMKMDAGLDTGDMALVEETEIGPRDTTATLHDRLAEMGARLMVDALAKLADGTLELTPQPDEGVTYAKKIDKAEAQIDWTRDDFEIVSLIHGLTPFPGAWFEHGGERIKVHDAHPVMIDPAGHPPPPGTVISDSLIVRCGNGFVQLETLQRAGKKAMSAGDFQRGKAIPVGARLG
ncbi:MAG: methionyl-tRNA formyltransferase [Minwuia sp.]|uniref:methionyl-tRNA formyltransferase n=1 Tax=Minwuia sp. TaxID=2493630 RepID=UPI003A86C75A